MTTYEDVAVNIKGYDGRVMVDLNESLRKYTETEVMDGANQYACPKCEKKVNAEKVL